MSKETKPNPKTHNTTPLTLDLSRRGFVATATAAVAGGLALARRPAHAAVVRTEPANHPSYGNGTLAPEIRSRAIAGVNGLRVHVLEAGFETAGRPAVLLLHGFPELAYSWRKVMPPLAAAGYHVIAPDQRGYGRTTGWDDSYDADPDGFRMLNMVRDAAGLAFALGYRHVAALVGHDAGPGRRLERAHPAGHIPLCGPDELAVCRRAGGAVRYRERRRPAAPTDDG